MSDEKEPSIQRSGKNSLMKRNKAQKAELFTALEQTKGQPHKVSFPERFLVSLMWGQRPDSVAPFQILVFTFKLIIKAIGSY